MAISSEEHVHLCIGLLRQHRCVPVYPHHPAFQSHHNQEGHPSPGQGEAPPSTARYWEAVLELLWPRFELILEMNIEIIRNTDPQKLDTQISSAIVEVENFVLKMAAEFPSRRDQLIFLINNYDMMLNVLMERAADDSKEVEGFQQLLQARNQFIEEILSSPLVA